MMYQATAAERLASLAREIFEQTNGDLDRAVPRLWTQIKNTPDYQRVVTERCFEGLSDAESPRHASGDPIHVREHKRRQPLVSKRSLKGLFATMKTGDGR
jgi:hypothetical protein